MKRGSFSIERNWIKNYCGQEWPRSDSPVKKLITSYLVSCQTVVVLGVQSNKYESHPYSAQVASLGIVLAGFLLKATGNI